MQFNSARARTYLQAGDLKTLFIEEMGWDRFRATLNVTVGTETFSLNGIAEKRGVQIFQCAPRADGKIPDSTIRRKIDTEVTKSAFQHLIVFADRRNTYQKWQWVAREAGKPLAVRGQDYHIGQSGEALIQKLERISFQIDEEEGLTLSGVTFRLKDAFDKERVTKKFYDRFEKEHASFLGFISNIPDADLQRWYASVMINRLMFLYFVQTKGFLDSDTRYLQNRLKQSKDNYYHDLLCPLFFEGFAQRHHSPETIKKLGKVPYLNGGLFTRHQIEERYGDAIAIPDTAFEKLFTFFDEYNWHLDDRPLSNDREINPDVLGYIFEKYVNQKQMGAYYTKEDITEYIGRNTILPFLLDRAREECLVAFQGDCGLWRLLQDDPDRYIFPAVKYGIKNEDSSDNPLPAHIAMGIHDVSARGEWNKPASSEFSLPTEIWREVVARRERCADVRRRLAAGEVQNVSDLITFNLNIRQFAQDCIEHGGTDFVQAVWNVLNGTRDGRLPMSILDPTCGSGAFLFAALEILEPLYEACLDRMASFVSDADQLGRGKDHTRFREILSNAAAHPDRRHFIYKSIIVNNLYGVDIMEEATEICKLRLFLKLAAQVVADHAKPNFGIEPLPDIDFNVRAGNTVIGFASAAQTERAVRGTLDFDNTWPRIQARAEAIAKLFGEFQHSQNDPAADSRYVAGMKKGMRDSLAPLRDDLDRYLAQQYGKIDKDSLSAWKKSAQPFHWFIEFYNVMRKGGFDVVVGNPPYVEYKDISSTYTVRDYTTASCSNLFAFVLERCQALAAEGARIGFIVPLSAFSTDRMTPLIKEVKRTSQTLHVANFSWRPGKLFDGVNLQLSIMIQQIGASLCTTYSTQYLLWDTEARSTLFSKVEYSVADDTALEGSIPKLGSSTSFSILAKLRTHSKNLGLSIAERQGHTRVLYRRGGLYWKVFVDFETGSSEEKSLPLLRSEDKYPVLAVLSSSLWFWYFTVTSDCRHLGNRDIHSFPLSPDRLSIHQFDKLNDLGQLYVHDLKNNAQQVVRVYKGVNAVPCLSFRVRKSKPIIDRIDAVLADHFGLTTEELDFIVNYDCRYRMRMGADEEDG